MIEHIKGVLNMSAFRHEPDDPAASWRQRFSHQKTALLQMGRNSLSYAIFDRHGEVVASEERHGADPKELLGELGEVIAEKTDEGWCTLSLNTRYVISVEHNLSRKQGSEDTIKTDPRSILHGRFERGKRYAVTNNPEVSSSLLVAYEEDAVKKVEAMFKDNRLKLGRICCGVYVLLRYALAQTNTVKGNEKPFSALYIACCAGSVCALVQEKDNWMELRSRPDVYDTDIQPLVDLVAPFQSRLPPDAGVVLVTDEPVEGLAPRLAELFVGRPLKDLSGDHLLAKILFQN